MQKKTEGKKIEEPKTPKSGQTTETKAAETPQPTQAAPKQEGLNVATLVVNTAMFTFVALICLAMWFLSVAYVIDPHASIKYFDFLGAPKASLAAYERTYQKSHENYDLYDLINKSISVGEYKTTLKYINELRTQTYYEAFVNEIDEISTEGIAKRYIALVGDYDGYLNGQYVIALYKSGDKEGALKSAAEDLNNQNLRSFALSAYFDCLYGDNTLTSYMADILNVSSYTFEDGQNLVEKLEQRREATDITNAIDQYDTVEKLVRLYTSMKIDNVLIAIYNNTGETELASEVAGELRALRTVYDSLAR